ncbi:gamma-glutamylcyclotransferase [Bacillus salacetis]|uniref:Gamma-glutamylcyclotransferase n=1 Tax=Bacillus salacetis TaxID=2315464 RepID=A0A3A1R1U1_9BACI|nr:gamma-glutamylcyclotransferase [Bacillus salacetis]
MDKFFSQTHCDRCGGSLKSGRIMSMYNTDCICLNCKDKESRRTDYGKAVEAEHNEIKKGNYNYKGIKGEN